MGKGPAQAVAYYLLTPRRAQLGLSISDAPEMFDLNYWLADPTLRVAHGRESTSAPERLWRCASSVELNDSRLLGRLVRWRIPGLAADLSFHNLFRHDPFIVLDGDQELGLLSGLVGRIWTMRRDYPQLSDPEEFRRWRLSGTARVLFANWVEPLPSGGAVLHSETRVQTIGAQARLGMSGLRPLVRAFQHLIASDGIEEAVRRAESR